MSLGAVRALLPLLAIAAASAAQAAEDPPPSGAPLDLAAAEARIHTLLDADRWREALAEALALRERLPEEPRARSLAGECLFRAGRLEEVEPTLASLTSDPVAPARALMTLARLREASGRFGDAVDLMRRAVEAGPDDRDVLYQAAGATATRAESVALLERYLARSEGDDEDTIAAAREQVRLFRALGERAVWVASAKPERLELPLHPLWVPESGEIVGYLIDVRVGPRGRLVRVLLDSGSPGLFVIERIARKCGFEPLADVTVHGGGGAGRHSSTRGMFGVLGAGDLEFTDVLASVAREELDPQGRYHGLLGLSAFNGYRVTLDLDRRRIVLAADAAEPGAGSPYFTVGGQMLVRAEIGRGESGLFLFDTGSTSTLVELSIAERVAGATLGPAVELPAVGGARRGARALTGIEVAFGGFTTGSRTLRAVDLSRRSRVGGVEIAGFLGLDLLGGKRVVIDTVGRFVRVAE